MSFPFHSRLLLTVFIYLFSFSLDAQIDTLRIENTTSAQIDSLLVTEKLVNKPRQALLWSIIPGGGQAYNKRWWKVPIVYGSLLGMIAYADYNQTRYTRYTKALENRCLGEGNVIDIPYDRCYETPDDFPVNRYPNSALITARNQADKGKQTAYIGIFAVYLLQAIEAYTDAHLQEFDIDDDLSFQVKPSVPLPGYAGASMVIQFNQRPKFARQYSILAKAGAR